MVPQREGKVSLSQGWPRGLAAKAERAEGELGSSPESLQAVQGGGDSSAGHWEAVFNSI